MNGNGGELCDWGWGAFLLAAMEKLRDSHESRRKEGAPVSEMAWRLTVTAAESMFLQNLAIPPDARLQGDAANNHISSGTAGASCSA